MALVAVAGPLVNLTLAALGALALRIGIGTDGHAGAMIRSGAYAVIGINCALAVLNLLPILPLDGGRIVTSLLPRGLARSYARLERVGLVVVMLLLTQTSILSTLVRPVLRSFLQLGTIGMGR
jgi:Zn-dependent protease